MRRTFGFKKDSDHIALSQLLNGIATRDGRILDRGVGLSNPLGGIIAPRGWGRDHTKPLA